MGNHGTQDAPITFASLTNQQKLDIIDAYFRRCVNDASRAQQVQDAQNAAAAGVVPPVV